MASVKPLALVLALLPQWLSAQESPADTSAFRAGQWGVQFGAGFGLANVGILRFTSPRSAWMLLLDVSGEFLNGTRTDVLGATSDQKDHTVGIATGVGKRFYQAARHKVRSFQSIGVAGSYQDQKQSITGTTFTFTQWRAGALGELGAGYWVTQNLSLGGTANVSAGYSHRLTDGGASKVDENGWFVSGVNVLLVFGLYF